jgi:hypothetical protein
MRNLSLVVIAVTMAACGGRREPPPQRPLGVAAHLEEAERHEAEAARAERLAAELAVRKPQDDFVCMDQALADQSTSGGERLIRSPCWAGEIGAVDRHRDDAARLRADAAEHRARARALSTAERTSCAGLTDAELDHTPFAHREDVAAVTAELEEGALRGARIRFAPVRGLDAAWLRGAIACHQARAAAVGFNPKYMSYDPTVIAGAEVSVVEDARGILVIVRAADDATSRIVYERAEELLADPR